MSEQNTDSAGATILDLFMQGEQVDALLDEAVKKVSSSAIDLSLAGQNATLDLSIATAAEDAEFIKRIQQEKMREKMQHIALANAERAKHSLF